MLVQFSPCAKSSDIGATTRPWTMWFREAPCQSLETVHVEVIRSAGFSNHGVECSLSTALAGLRRQPKYQLSVHDSVSLRLRQTSMEICETASWSQSIPPCFFATHRMPCIAVMVECRHVKQLPPDHAHAADGPGAWIGVGVADVDHMETKYTEALSSQYFWTVDYSITISIMSGWSSAFALFFSSLWLDRLSTIFMIVHSICCLAKWGSSICPITLSGNHWKRYQTLGKMLKKKESFGVPTNSTTLPKK